MKMFSRKMFGALIILLALTGAFMMWSISPVESRNGLAPVTPTPLTTPRARPPHLAQAPAISFIDSQTPMCYSSVTETGVCYLQWNYLYVTASASQYIISMTLEINGDVRAYHAGFFQTSMYIAGEMYNPGFKVVCGLPGAGGNPLLGNAYNYTIRARETGGLSATNYGTVTCPASAIHFNLPAIYR